MNGDKRPRDPAGGDDAGGEQTSELVELSETRLPTKLEVAPAAVGLRDGRRRLDPRLGAGIAVAIVLIAVLGSGPLAPRPSPSPSPMPSDIGVASVSPSATLDSCPGADQRPPTVTLGAAPSAPARAATAPGDAGFEAPTEHFMEVSPGARMLVELNDRRCVELVGIDIADTANPTRSGLTVRAPTALEPDRRSANWQAPPAGDWIVRVSVLLRGLAPSDADTPWAVYFFRLNSGPVAWASPLPSGVGGVAEVPMVTPTVPCGSLPYPDRPPAVHLEVGDTVVPGIRLYYDWRNREFEKSVAEGLAAVPPIELAWPFTLRIVGDFCATSWTVMAGPMPAGEAEFAATLGLEQSPLNEANSPNVAAQNTFAIAQEAYGTYVIEAALTFENGDRESMYWLVHAAMPALPVARVIPGPSEEPVVPVAGCGAAFQSGDRYATEVCIPFWADVGAEPPLGLPSGSALQVDADGETIVSWSVAFADAPSLVMSGGVPECAMNLLSGVSDVGLEVIALPELPVGDWVVQISLTVRTATGFSTAPYYLHVRVDGQVSPAPNAACPGIIE